MTGGLDRLTPDQLPPLSEAVKKCVASYLKNDGRTYGQLADTLCQRNGRSLYITAEAIRQYMHRGTTRVNRDNKCLDALSHYFTDPSVYDTFSIETQRVIKSNSSDLFPGSNKESPFSRESIDLSFGLALYNWLGVSELSVETFAEHMYSREFSRSVIIRQSTVNQSQMVKSLFSVKKVKAERSLLYARRIHIDRYGRKRYSSGFIVPLDHSIYFVMNVAEGSGLEFISLKRPLQKDFERMFGFMMTLNSKREIISAQVFMEPEVAEWVNVPARFDAVDAVKDSFFSKDQKRLKALGGDSHSCFTTYDDHLDIDHFRNIKFEDDEFET